MAAVEILPISIILEAKVAVLIMDYSDWNSNFFFVQLPMDMTVRIWVIHFLSTEPWKMKEFESPPWMVVLLQRQPTKLYCQFGVARMISI